jgi:putative nucleotidyltransferase with HDIG domain
MCTFGTKGTVLQSHGTHPQPLDPPHPTGDDSPGRSPVRPPTPLNRETAAFVLLTILIGGSLAVMSFVEVFRAPFSPVWLALLALTACAGWATLRVPSMPISFSISETFSVIAALLIGPAAGALTAALDGLVLSFRMARTPRALHRVLFNIASPVISTWTAAQLFFRLADAVPAAAGAAGALRLLTLLAAFGCANFLLNTGIVALAVAFEQRRRPAVIWREHFAHLWVTHLGGVFAAMLMLVLSGVQTGLPARGTLGIVEVLILIAPLPVILWVTFRHAMGRAADQIVQLERMNKVYVGAIEALAQAIDAKDQVTHDHIRRVQQNSIRLARALGVQDEMQIQAIKAAALLHDVGKLGVPEHILNKPGRLSATEFEIMKRHAPVGADILAMIGFPYPVVPIVRHHHENWDGSGYPDGLSGDEIPIGARILSVVDCFDALTSDRPYRPQLPDGDALAILLQRRGNMYDPRVIDMFFEMYRADHGHVRIGVNPESSMPAGRTSAPGVLAAGIRIDLPASAATAAWAAGAAIWNALEGRMPTGSTFVLFSYEETSDALLAEWSTPESPIQAGARIAVGERLSGWVAASRQPIFNSDARLDLDGEVRASTDLRMALAVPALRDDRRLGVLTFYTRNPDGFSEVHLATAEAAARAWATALPADSSKPAA